jgi:hypothetical protein
MQRALRMLLLVTASTFALAFSSAALAAYTPSLTVSPAITAAGAPSGATTIHIKSSQSDDPTAVIQIFVPATVSVNTSAAVGTTIGTVTASAQGGPEVGGITVPLSGTVTVASPTTPASDQCSPGAHLAVWNLNLSIAGTTQLPPIPVYVDNAPANLSAFGGHVIRVCLPPPDVPVGTPGRSAQGAKLLDANFGVTGIFTNPSASGEYLWTGLFTPYVPSRGVPNQAGTVQSRAYVRLPGRVTIGAKYVRRTNTFQLKGRVTEGGNGLSTRVIIRRGLKTAALIQRSSTVAKANGNWATAGHLKPRKATLFRAEVVVPERDITATGCTGAQVFPCVSATVNGWKATSALVRLKV